MTNTEIIKKAQEACGEYATGYRQDIGIDTIAEICRMMWVRSANLSYSFTQWSGEVCKVVGKKNFVYWLDEIMDYQHKMINAAKYFVFHGQRYCA